MWQMMYQTTAMTSTDAVLGAVQIGASKSGRMQQAGLLFLALLLSLASHRPRHLCLLLLQLHPQRRLLVWLQLLLRAATRLLEEL